MALDGNRLGSAIAATILSFRPAANVKITDAQLEQMWQAVGRNIVDEIEQNADIVLDIGDIKIPGSSGLISSSPGNPVTGIGLNDAVTLSSKIT